MKDEKRPESHLSFPSLPLRAMRVSEAALFLPVSDGPP